MRPLSLIGANGGFFHDSTRRRSTLHGMDQGAMIYDLGVGWRDAAVVSADCGIATVRRDRHPHYARICCDEMGIRLADRVYRRGWCVSLRSRLPRAAARAARTLRFRTLAASAGIGDALRCRRWRRNCRRRGAFEPPSPWRCHRNDSGIYAWFRLRLDDFPGAVHARHGRGLFLARVGEHVRSGTGVYEFPYGGDVTGHDGTQAMR